MITNFKNWTHKMFLNILKKRTEEFKISYRLIDESLTNNDQFCGSIEWQTRPYVGDKILLNKNIPLIQKPKVFIIEEIFINATGYSGICKGKVQLLTSEYY